MFFFVFGIGIGIAIEIGFSFSTVKLDSDLNRESVKKIHKIRRISLTIQNYLYYYSPKFVSIKKETMMNSYF